LKFLVAGSLPILQRGASNYTTTKLPLASRNMTKMIASAQLKPAAMTWAE
jgi:hypothetical protein